MPPFRRRRRGFTLIELLVVIAIMGILIGLLLAAVQRVREAASRTACANNLKQLGLALHNYRNQHRVFPPGVTPAPNRHTWIAHILPHVEQGNLQNRYNFTVNWLDSSNHAAISTPLKLLQCPSTPEQGRTDQFPNNGPAVAVSDYAAPSGVAPSLVQAKLVPPRKRLAGILTNTTKGPRVDQINDGVSNTILVGEDAGRPRFWTRNGPGPANNNPGGGNLPVVNGRVRGAGWADPVSLIPLHGFSANGLMAPGPCAINCTNNNEAFAFHRVGANFLFGDGAVRFLSQNIDIKTYAALVTRDGGEVVSGSDY